MDAQPGPSKLTTTYDDPDFEKTVLKWLDEVEDDPVCQDGSADVDESDLESDGDYIGSDHDTDSSISVEEYRHEQELNEELPESTEIDEANKTTSTEESNINRYVYGKNRFKWSLNPMVPKSTRTLQHNIVLKCPGLRGSNALQKTSKPIEDWSRLFTEQMLADIVQWTNVKIRKERQKYKNPLNSDLRDLDVTELRGFFGLLLYTSIFKSNHEDIRSIFATDGTGRDIFRCVTNANRFAVILSCLRFDNLVDRSERRKTDPVAPISELFNSFVANCQREFVIGTGACIDEMLIPFRGRCKFKMYMPKKPAKYGLKIMALTDSRSGYFLNGYIYHGKDSDGYTLSDDEKKYSKPSQAVIRLSKPIQGTNRNITADNWFSSMEIVNYLTTKKLTYVGTLKKNKREIPLSFLPSKQRSVGSSLYGFTRTVTLLSYVTKKNKAVILLSSVHHNEYTDPRTGKPEIIEYYNCYKGGVDSLDEKCSVYSTGRRTQRWPMAIFYRLLDISSVNSYILHQSHRDNTKITRLEFIKTLAFQLVSPVLKIRMINYKVNREVRACIRRVLGETQFPLDPPEQEAGKLIERNCLKFLCGA